MHDDGGHQTAPACPSCGAVFLALTEVSVPGVAAASGPEPGDCFVCPKCGERLVFTEGMQLRLMTVEDRRRVFRFDPAALEAIDVRHRDIRERGRVGVGRGGDQGPQGQLARDIAQAKALQLRPELEKPAPFARPPDLSGPFGRAWRLSDAGAAMIHAQVVSWLVQRPGVHKFWSWWMVTIIDLGPLPGYLPAPKKYPEAEYELIFTALEAGKPMPNPEGPPCPLSYILPFDLDEQFHGLTQAQMLQLAAWCARSIVVDGASPDSDHRPWWQTAVAAAVESMRAGGPLMQQVAPEHSDAGCDPVQLDIARKAATALPGQVRDIARQLPPEERQTLAAVLTELGRAVAADEAVSS